MQTTIVWQKCLIVDPATKKCLVMQRSDYKKDGGKRDMVWWSVDFGEDMHVAIRRESVEETGVVLKNICPLHVCSRLFTDNAERFFVFVLWVCEQRDMPNNEIILSSEHTVYKWVSIDELCQLDLRDTVAYVLPQIKEYFQ